VLMAASIKFNGSLILQMMGEGSLRMAVAECSPGYGLRATAQWREPLAEGPLEQMLGAAAQRHAARCVITLDPLDRLPGQQPYQGIVALHDDAGQPYAQLAEVLAQYMARSEQIDTRFVLACDGKQACGVLLQRMPLEGGVADAGRAAASHDAFDTALAVIGTLQADELLATETATLLHRLFWQQDVQAWNAQRDGTAPHFHCTCSRDKVRDMLRMLGRDEVESIIAERGAVDVNCEFCGAAYHFDLVDAAQALLARDVLPPGGAQAQ
ncbi:MAG: Hsp33 family molecular chaperone HslO, partial [Betaproteobacteria bacterium]|nr:Hsp33 family molecular chaperone HslO [Betaproteobacteria bacterium]